MSNSSNFFRERSHLIRRFVWERLFNDAITAFSSCYSLSLNEDHGRVEHGIKSWNEIYDRFINANSWHDIYLEIMACKIDFKHITIKKAELKRLWYNNPVANVIYKKNV
jgi:hypothetical protein